jgi:hypothetical protein
VSAKIKQTSAFRGAFCFTRHREHQKNLMLEFFSSLSTQAWFKANRIAGYALLNLIDDPAILAMAFC